jgi:hypothetical protein
LADIQQRLSNCDPLKCEDDDKEIERQVDDEEAQHPRVVDHHTNEANKHAGEAWYTTL